MRLGGEDSRLGSSLWNRYGKELEKDGGMWNGVIRAELVVMCRLI